MNGARRCIATGLCLWGAGVQVGEAFGAAGMGLTVVGLTWAWAQKIRRGQPEAANAVQDRAGSARTVTDAAQSRDADMPVTGPEQLRAFWPIWLFIGWALLGPLLGGGWPTWSGFFRTLDWGFVAIGALAFAELDGRGRRAVAIACGAALAASCLVAAFQFFGVWPSREAMRPLSVLHPSFERVYEPASAGSTSRFMAGGLLFHRLKFAAVGGVFALWAVALAARLRGRERLIAAGVAAFALLSVLVFPVVRAGALALVAAAALTAALALERKRAALALGSALLVLGGGAVALNPEMRARVAAATSLSGDLDRVHLRRAGLHALAKHPIVGLGAGRFRANEHMEAEAPESVKHHRGKAHLQLLSIAVETGISGAVLFALMLLWLARRLWPRGAAGLGALAFLVLMGLLHDPLFHAETSMAFAFVLAAALSTQPPAQPNRMDVPASAWGGRSASTPSRASSPGSATTAWVPGGFSYQPGSS